MNVVRFIVPTHNSVAVALFGLIRLTAPNPRPAGFSVEDHGVTNLDFTKKSNYVSQRNVAYGKIAGSHDLNHLSDLIRAILSFVRWYGPTAIITRGGHLNG